MSGAVLPLPEPPADDVDQVLELLRAAREHVRDAERTAHMLLATLGEDAGGQPLPAERALYYQLELMAAEYRRSLWEAHLAALTARARSLGLQP